jgi:hypothetical protein
LNEARLNKICSWRYERSPRARAPRYIAAALITTSGSGPGIKQQGAQGAPEKRGGGGGGAPPIGGGRGAVGNPVAVGVGGWFAAGPLRNKK